MSIRRIPFPYQVPEDVRILSACFQESGYEMYLVGGCVRDMVLELAPNDYDFITSASGEEIVQVLKDHDLPCDDQYLFLNYVISNMHGEKIDICAYKGGSMEEDLLRRDLTINGLAYDIHTGEILDVSGGYEDLKNRIIRFSPGVDLEEAPTNILRAIRFAVQLDFRIAEESYRDAEAHAPALEHVRTSQVVKFAAKTLAHSKARLMNSEQPEAPAAEGVPSK